VDAVYDFPSDSTNHLESACSQESSHCWNQRSMR
jgi:hypothetical protein